MEIKLKIEYQCEVPEEDMEKGLEKYLSQYGWKWEGSGYDFADKIRDISFYKPNFKNKSKSK